MQLRLETSTLIAATTLMPFPEGFDLWAFADREKEATHDTIADVPAVQARHNSLYVQLPGSTLAILTPAARQEAARYIRSLATSSQAPLPTTYLTRTAQLPHQIVIAIDLQDVARPDHLKQEVASLETVRGNAAGQQECRCAGFDPCGSGSGLSEGTGQQRSAAEAADPATGL
jgi:hypothetical protein